MKSKMSVTAAAAVVDRPKSIIPSDYVYGGDESEGLQRWRW
jgi:hypothetical protein